MMDGEGGGLRGIKLQAAELTAVMSHLWGLSFGTRGHSAQWHCFAKVRTPIFSMPFPTCSGTGQLVNLSPTPK